VASGEGVPPAPRRRPAAARPQCLPVRLGAAALVQG